MDPNILVVDDEREIIDMVKRNLEIEGYSVDGETDPEEALEAVKQGDYKIVITDIKMPDMNGVELLKKIKEIDGTIQVLMITGYVQMNHLVSSLSNGAVDCIFKPLDFDRLLDAIENCCKKLERWQEVLGRLGTLED